MPWLVNSFFPLREQFPRLTNLLARVFCIPDQPSQRRWWKATDRPNFNESDFPWYFRVCPCAV